MSWAKLFVLFETLLQLSMSIVLSRSSRHFTRPRYNALVAALADSILPFIFLHHRIDFQWIHVRERMERSGKKYRTRTRVLQLLARAAVHSNIQVKMYRLRLNKAMAASVQTLYRVSQPNKHWYISHSSIGVHAMALPCCEMKRRPGNVFESRRGNALAGILGIG